MAKDKGILEKAKESLEEIGEKGGVVIKNITGDGHKKTRTHTKGRKTTKKK